LLYADIRLQAVALDAPRDNGHPDPAAPAPANVLAATEIRSLTHTHAAPADEIAEHNHTPETALPPVAEAALPEFEVAPDSASAESAAPESAAPEPEPVELEHAAPEPAVPEPAVPEPAPVEPVAIGAAVTEPVAPEALAIEAVAIELPATDAAEDDQAEPAEDEQAEATEDTDPLAPGAAFTALGLSDAIVQAVIEMGYLVPTPIQAQAIPVVLMGRDVLGCAQTGTGKTAGFTLPMLDILTGSRARARMPRSLILEPTRELALQVAENFIKYGKYLKLNHALLIGGESLNDQKDALMRGVDVLIATPGRLIDLFERGGMLLTDTRLLVIDEADRMLDMGFIPDVERIVSLLPRTRQTLFFSATMAPEIRRLADAFLQNPKEITVSRPASVATTITEGFALVAEHDKREALRRLIRSEQVQNALVFCNRKRDVDILHKSLTRHNFNAGALHGDMSQPMRFATLEKFKNNELQLLVCSDVAARGLDIGGLSHVFNFDVPHHAEDYVHRIGRTGRAGREGRAFTLATPEDRLAVAAIEKLVGKPIPRIVIPELDPVEWAEGDSRKRRGRGAPKTAEKPAREAAKPRARGGRKSGKSNQAEFDEPDFVVAQFVAPTIEQPELDALPPILADHGVVAESGAADIAAPDAETAKADRPKRERGRGRGRGRGERAETPKPDEAGAEQPHIALPRPEPVREQQPRAEQPRKERPRAEAPVLAVAEPRRDDRSRDDARRRGRNNDDLGPSVLGFGDDVPAFMKLPIRIPRPIGAEPESDAA